MTKALKMINIHIYMVWERGQWETGNFKMFQWGRDTLVHGKRDIIPSGNDFILWERFYPLGIRPLILWELDHLSSGIRDILWKTVHLKRDALSSGIQTTYPLGNMLWESGIWEIRYMVQPLFDTYTAVNFYPPCDKDVQ